MNSTKVSLQGLEEKTQAFFKNQDHIRKQKEKNRRRKNRRNKELIGFLLVIVFILSIYAINLLFSDNSRGHAMERVELTERETAVQDIELRETVSFIKEEAVEKVEGVKQEPVEVVEKEVVETPVQTSSVYNPNIPMPKEHQEYLYELTKERGLDYKKTLAVIKHESVFDANVVNETNDYGYFQINLINHEDLSSKLGTSNQPLDPYTNMQWGTYMLADLYSYWSERGYSGQGLDDAVWSSYNRGLTGFKNNGHATEYIHKMKGAIAFIHDQF